MLGNPSLATPADFDGPVIFSRVPSRIFTNSKRVLGGSADTVNTRKPSFCRRGRKMKPDKSEMCSNEVESRAQPFRDKSRQLRETALTIVPEVDRRDMEWLAETYEMLANSAERLERAGQ
jgi:hypothetical protein